MSKKKKKKTIYPISRVHWLDTNATKGWHKVDELVKEGLEVHSVGFLVYEDDDIITLATSVTAWHVGDVLNIVKACVIDRWDLT